MSKGLLFSEKLLVAENGQGTDKCYTFIFVCAATGETLRGHTVYKKKL